MANDSSLSINIPEEHYVTFHFRDNDIYPLGFLVPEGKDQSAQKRKATADRWANQSKVKVPAKIFKNKPMVGFEIRKTVKYRSRNSSKETWRIIDPRGFELEISNVNMEFIIDHCILDKGEIISSCIWGRDGGENLLLPVDCKEYKDAAANTERQGKKASMREVKIGDHVTFKKGTKGRYLGKFYKYQLNINEYDGPTEPVDHSSAKQYVFVNPDNTLTITGSVQVSEINKSEPITEAEAELLANQLAIEACKKYRYSDSVVALCAEDIDFADFEKEMVPFASNDLAAADGYFHAIANNGTSSRWIVDTRSSSYSYQKDNITVSEIDASQIVNYMLKYILTTSNSYYGSSRMTPKRSSVDLKNFEATFSKECVKFRYKTALGNEIVIKL